MAPEVILNSPDEKSSSSCDVWSFGLVLVEVLFGCDLWPNQGLRQIVKNVIGLLAVQDVLQKIANECGKSKEYAVGFSCRP